MRVAVNRHVTVNFINNATYFEVYSLFQHLQNVDWSIHIINGARWCDTLKMDLRKTNGKTHVLTFKVTSQLRFGTSTKYRQSYIHEVHHACFKRSDTNQNVKCTNENFRWSLGGNLYDKSAEISISTTRISFSLVHLPD